MHTNPATVITEVEVPYSHQLFPCHPKENNNNKKSFKIPRGQAVYHLCKDLGTGGIWPLLFMDGSPKQNPLLMFSCKHPYVQPLCHCPICFYQVFQFPPLCLELIKSRRGRPPGFLTIFQLAKAVLTAETAIHWPFCFPVGKGLF